MSHLPPDALLSQVMATVTAVFGHAMAPDDNFFDAGGDSVAAVELADLLEERIGTDVDIELIHRAESFGALAAELAGGPVPAGVRAAAEED